MAEKYIVNNTVAVLISPGFGAGWSTWNDSKIATDARIVKKLIEECPTSEQMQDFLNSIGYEHIYMGGYDNLTVVYVPVGKYYKIREYDGSESIEIFDPELWDIA